MTTPENPFPAPTPSSRPTRAAQSAETSQTHEETISSSLRKRLKVICEGMSPSEFDALIVTMTREQLRGERRAHR